MVQGTKRSRRRSLLIGVVAMLVVAALARPAMGQEHSGPMPDPAPGILPPGEWTPEQVAFAVALVDRAEKVLPARFGDLSKVQALGYHNFGVTVPGGYDHWGLPLSAAGDGRDLDLDLPESLVFQHLADGSQVLVAALFVLDPGSTMADVPSEYAWLPGWHTHVNESCVDDNSVAVGRPVDGVCVRGHQVLEPMLHVWITDNPCHHRFAGIGAEGPLCVHDETPAPPSPGSTVTPPGPAGSDPTVPSLPAPSTSSPPGAAGPSTTVPSAPPVKAPGAPEAIKATPTYAG
jgi:hypothetical protein